MKYIHVAMLPDGLNEDVRLLFQRLDPKLFGPLNQKGSRAKRDVYEG